MRQQAIPESEPACSECYLDGYVDGFLLGVAGSLLVGVLLTLVYALVTR